MFSKKSEASNHEALTNQRALCVNNDKNEITEENLWLDYIRQKYGQQCQQIDIILVEENYKIRDRKSTKILLDNHDNWLKQNDNIKKIKNKKYGINYYEFVGTQSATNHLREAISKNEADSIIKGRIIEMALTNVVVLDERIQNKFTDKLSEECAENPKYANLFIPPKSNGTDLDNVNTPSVCKWIKDALNGKQLDYLLVHRSLLGKGKLDEAIMRTHFSPMYFVHVSGGGTPPKLDKGEYYLPFEVLNNCLGGNHPSKFVMVNVLKSLRKIS